jgi:hypothetical protein
MLQMNRWWAALAALVVGGGVSALLLVAADPTRNTTEVYVAEHDLPAGASVGPEVLALERISVAPDHSLLFVRGEETELIGMHASHDLAAGQLIQHTDVMDASAMADRRLVFVPVKDVPATVAGAKVDLLAIVGTGEHPTVVPFAIGIEVRAAVSGGLVVVVASKQAAALVYAAQAMRLAAVIAEPGAAAGAEGAISSPDQAMAAAAQP